MIQKISTPHSSSDLSPPRRGQPLSKGQRTIGAGSRGATGAHALRFFGEGARGDHAASLLSSANDMH